jgi:hypothetical protein
MCFWDKKVFGSIEDIIEVTHVDHEHGENDSKIFVFLLLIFIVHNILSGDNLKNR